MTGRVRIPSASRRSRAPRQARNFGNVGDFTNGEDKIDLSAFAGVSFDDLTITSSGAIGTKVDVDNGGTASFFLWNVAADDLDESDFIFQDTTVDAL